jgi:hypothetical protein
MKLKRHRGRAGFALLGVMAVSATGVLADQPAGLSFSCTGGARTEAAHVAELCADFLQAVRSQPDLSGADLQDAPLSGGPGLEIEITEATDTKIEVIPTWIDAVGQRAVRPSVGILTMDTTLTRSRRLAFFQRLLADLPR